MTSDLKVMLMMNSSALEVLGWKCVGLQDMNLEIHVRNTGRGVVRIKSEVWFLGEAGEERVDYLFPHGVHPLGPDETKSFFCSYDESKMSVYSHVAVIDSDGVRHVAPITGRMERAEKGRATSRRIPG